MDAYPHEVFPGKVTVVSESLDPVMRRFQVRCECGEQSEQTQTRNVRPPESHRRHQFKIAESPQYCIIHTGTLQFSFCRTVPRVLQRRRVTLGLQDADLVYIKEGLHAGERVVTSGAILLNSELSGSD